MTKIDRWREDMLDAVSRVDRMSAGVFNIEDVEKVFDSTTVLIEDLVREVSRLRILLRDLGIDND